MKTNIMDRLLEVIPSNIGMELPPKVFKDMDGEFIEFIEEKSLTARFPNKERFMNPFGFMQGGIIVAAIDNTVSPLSYVLAPPNITKEITTTFKRPIKQTDSYIDVIASLLEKTSTHIVLQAEVRKENGKLAAIDQGRTASYPTAPSQIPACGITAQGSSKLLALHTAFS